MSDQAERKMPTGVYNHREAQIKAQHERIRREREELEAAWRLVLKTPVGRMVIWSLIEHCQPFQSIWDNSAKIHKNAGRQDVGHFILSQVEAADQEALFQMMREGKERQITAQAVNQKEGETNVG